MVRGRSFMAGIQKRADGGNRRANAAITRRFMICSDASRLLYSIKSTVYWGEVMVAIAEILTSEGNAKGLCTRGNPGLEKCSYRYNAEIENYYVRNRCYSPTLGRWPNRDPIGYQGGINLYGYVDSSPVGNVDTEGLQVFVYGVAVDNTPDSPAAAPAGPPPASPAPRLRGPLCPTCQRLYRKAALDLSVLNNISERIHVINLGLQAFTGPGHFPVPHGYSISAARAERDRLFGELQIMRRLYLSDENAIAKAGCPSPNLWPSGGPPKKPGLKLMPGTADAVGEVVGEAVQEIIFASAGI